MENQHTYCKVKLSISQGRLAEGCIHRLNFSSLEIGRKYVIKYYLLFSSTINPLCVSYLWGQRNDDISKDATSQEHRGKEKVCAEAPLFMLYPRLPLPHDITSPSRRMFDRWEFVFWLRHITCRLFGDEMTKLWRICCHSVMAPQLCKPNGVVCGSHLIFALHFIYLKFVTKLSMCLAVNYSQTQITCFPSYSC